MKANTAEEPVDVLVRRRFRELRVERGLTLQQVAEPASIDISTLSRLEAGKRLWGAQTRSYRADLRSRR